MFENRQELSSLIKEVMESNEISILDAIIHICEKYNIDEESFASMVRQSHKLKEELRKEAVSLRMVTE